MVVGTPLCKLVVVFMVKVNLSLGVALVSDVGAVAISDDKVGFEYTQAYRC